jgi:hypothetical protein
MQQPSARRVAGEGGDFGKIGIGGHGLCPF